MTTAAERWGRELRLGGAVKVTQRPALAIVGLLLGVAFVVGGLARALVAPDLRTALGHGWIAPLGALLVLIYGRWLSARGPVVLVDAQGISAPRRRGEIPWTVVERVYVLEVGVWMTLRILQVVVDHEFLPDYYRRHRWPAWLLRLNRVRRIPLPPNLAVDSREFAAWLSSEAVRHRAA